MKKYEEQSDSCGQKVHPASLPNPRPAPGKQYKQNQNANSAPVILREYTKLLSRWVHEPPAAEDQNTPDAGPAPGESHGASVDQKRAFVFGRATGQRAAAGRQGRKGRKGGDDGRSVGTGHSGCGAGRARSVRRRRCPPSSGHAIAAPPPAAPPRLPSPDRWLILLVLVMSAAQLVTLLTIARSLAQLQLQLQLRAPAAPAAPVPAPVVPAADAADGVAHSAPLMIAFGTIIQVVIQQIAGLVPHGPRGAGAGA